MADRFSNTGAYYLVEGFYPKTCGIGPNGKFYGACKLAGQKQYVSVVLAGIDAKIASESAAKKAAIPATQLVEKDLSVPNRDSNKDKKTVRNKMGHDEQILDGQRTLNELEPPEAKQPLPEGKNVRNRRLNEENDSSGVAPIGSGGEGAPGGGNKHKMGHLGGKGVAERTPTKDTVGKYPTDTTESGKEWPRTQKNTGGGWEEFQPSPTGNAPEAVDGVTKKHGGNMTGELGQNSKQKNKGASMEEVPGTGHEMTWAKTGGESAPNASAGSTNESWSVDAITNLMEGGDFNLQALFDNYAASGGYISVDDFQSLCESYGVGFKVSEGVLRNLMSANRQYYFAESSDYMGRFWYAASHMGQQRLAEGLGADGLADGPEDPDGMNDGAMGDMGFDEEGGDGLPPEDDMDNPMSNVDPGGISQLDTDDIEPQETPDESNPFQGEMGVEPSGMDGDMDDMGGAACGPGGCDMQSLVQQITQEVVSKFTAMMAGGAGDMAAAANPAAQPPMGGEEMGEMGDEIDGFADSMDDDGALDYPEDDLDDQDMGEDMMPGSDMGMDGMGDSSQGRDVGLTGDRHMGDMDDMDDTMNPELDDVSRFRR